MKRAVGNLLQSKRANQFRIETFRDKVCLTPDRIKRNQLGRWG